jgi:hypothetical protein
VYNPSGITIKLPYLAAYNPSDILGRN